MHTIFTFLLRCKPYAYALLGVSLLCLLVLFFANDFFTQHFTWAPTRGEIIKAAVGCVLFALLVVAGLLALPVAVVAAAILTPFIDHSFLSIFKVTWVILTMLFAIGFFLGKFSDGRGKPQWEIDKERQDAERQAKTMHERNIRI